MEDEIMFLTSPGITNIIMLKKKDENIIKREKDNDEDNPFAQINFVATKVVSETTQKAEVESKMGNIFFFFLIYFELKKRLGKLKKKCFLFFIFLANLVMITYGIIVW